MATISPMDDAQKWTSIGGPVGLIPPDFFNLAGNSKNPTSKEKENSDGPQTDRNTISTNADFTASLQLCLNSRSRRFWQLRSVMRVEANAMTSPESAIAWALQRIFCGKMLMDLA
jgi:hypothetical protein